MLNSNKFDEKAKHIYEAHKEEWEKLYNGKIIAIDIDANDFVSIQYFTNWIEKSFSFIPISKYFRLNV